MGRASAKRSNTVTRWPASASSAAAAWPPTPQPTMAMSKVVMFLSPTPWGRGKHELVSQPAVHHQRLARDVVAVGTAEQVDRTRGFFRPAAAAEWDHLVHGGDATALDADLDLPALDFDLALVA